MHHTPNNSSSSEISDTDSEISLVGQVSKSYHTPTSRFKVKASTSRDIPGKERQMTRTGESSTPVANSVSPSPSSARTLIGSPATPSQNTWGSQGTPSSRLKATERAFRMSNRTPSKPPRKSENTVKPENKSTVIVIEDSDDEVPTDTDIFQLPTPPASFKDVLSPTSTNSSMYSTNSLFSVASAFSSTSSVGSPKMNSTEASIGLSTKLPSSKVAQTSAQYCDPLKKSPRPAKFGHPVVQDDIFSAQASNMTSPQPQIVPTRPNSPLSSRRVEDEIPGLYSFAGSAFGTNLKPIIIAHDKETQALLDQHQISWGTQYELARGVSLRSWTWEEVKERLNDLTGDNAHAACQVPIIMRGKSVASTNPSDLYLWKELDREQAAIQENKSRGLGLMGEWQGITNWYGGQVQQIMRLVKNGSGYKLIVEPMEKRRSYRFARFYGSRRFLQVRISEDIFLKENDAIRNFFVAKFILCGRVFVPFHSKDRGLYMVETNENWERESGDWCGDQFRKPFREFINWHNPLTEEKNYSQAMTKYTSRFALGLSNSVPALEFAMEDIYFIDDIAASDWPKAKGKPPTEKLMTDGCGLINHKALLTIVRSFNYDSLPAGVQGRIDGSKGLWILHPTDDSDVPKIWIRDSQNKIKNSNFDRAHRIFDLLAPSRPSSSIALSAQSIVNIFSNGIPDIVLIHLMEQGLLNEISPLLEWNKPHAMVFLWDAVNKCGKVSGTRTQRLASSLNRVLGLKGRDWGRDEHPEREDLDDEGDLRVDEMPFSTFTGRNAHSGAPLALYESAVELIQAGFHPAQNKRLFDKIGYVIQQAIQSAVEKFRIPISESLGAYVVPDPLGILKEGEIFYRSSRPQKDLRTEMLFDVLTGDVIVGRYPIRLPSDMQKVKAVDVTELYRWLDVVIISTQGSCSLASLLSGGDTDGDELIVLWDPLLVKNFKSKPLTKCPENVIPDAFLPLNDVEKVAEFCNRIYTLLPPRDANEAFQKKLMSSLAENHVGLYSTCHDRCVAMFGYEHPESIRLAYIIATLLDASKTGFRLQPGILDKDRKRYSPWAQQPADSESFPDILKQLKVAGDKKGRELLEYHEKAGLGINEYNHPDKDLAAPYNAASDHALKVLSDTNKKDFTDEMTLIRQHVNRSKKTFDRATAPSNKEKTSPKSKKKGFRIQSDQDDVTLNAAREYADPIENILLIRDVEAVKASYAYRVNPNFAFSVAFKQLCLMKACASADGIAPSRRIFDEGKSFTPSFLRALPRCENESGRSIGG